MGRWVAYRPGGGQPSPPADYQPRKRSFAVNIRCGTKNGALRESTAILDRLA